MVELTQKAIQKLTELHKQQKDDALRLRIMVTEGGCSGQEYGMKFDRPVEEDVHVGQGDAELIIDPESLEKMKGSVVDFDDGLHGSGFRITNPQASETCGCGRSFN